MKTLAVLTLFAVVAFVYSEIAEKDVIRVFDPNFRIEEPLLREVLNDAKLEQFGFKIDKEISIRTDENGTEKILKKTTYLTDVDCDKMSQIKELLQARLNGHLVTDEIAQRFEQEIELVDESATKCTMGIELHHSTGGSRVRRAGRATAKGCVIIIIIKDGGKETT